MSPQLEMCDFRKQRMVCLTSGYFRNERILDSSKPNIFKIMDKNKTKPKLKNENNEQEADFESFS